MTTGLTKSAIWLRLACAVLLLSLGVAHKPVHAAPSDDPAGSYFLLPDGTFSDLCITGADKGMPGKPSFAGGCDVCRLSANILLPTPPVAHAPAALNYRDIEPLAHDPSVAAPVARPGSPVRGPPVFLA
jgi:hypothetical protein